MLFKRTGDNVSKKQLQDLQCRMQRGTKDWFNTPGFDPLSGKKVVK